MSDEKQWNPESSDNLARWPSVDGSGRQPAPAAAERPLSESAWDRMTPEMLLEDAKRQHRDKLDAELRCETLERQLAEAREEIGEYETIYSLLKHRFPRNPDGSYPDFAIEDVLRENERLRSRPAVDVERVVEAVRKAIDDATKGLDVQHSLDVRDAAERALRAALTKEK